MADMDSGEAPIKVPKGTLIIREGEVDRDAYIIVSGRVEVFRDSGTSHIVLAELGPGQIFGEMALVLERPRTASVRAIEEAALRRIDPETFARALAPAKDLLPLVRLIFERLRTVNSASLHNVGLVLRGGGTQGGEVTPAELRHAGLKHLPVISGATPRAAACLGVSGGSVRVARFPYRIGRRGSEALADLLSHNDLYIDDKSPSQVSRNHCSINHFPAIDTFFIQDRGSTCGTIVNGKTIGLSSAVNQAALDRTSNEIVLGGADSAFRFTVTFEAIPAA